MFKNKTFLVKMVNDKTVVDEPDAIPPMEPHEYLALAKELTLEASGYAMVLVGYYIVADTCRQIVVHTAKTLIK